MDIRHGTSQITPPNHALPRRFAHSSRGALQPQLLLIGVAALNVNRGGGGDVVFFDSFSSCIELPLHTVCREKNEWMKSRLPLLGCVPLKITASRTSICNYYTCKLPGSAKSMHTALHCHCPGRADASANMPIISTPPEPYQP